MGEAVQVSGFSAADPDAVWAVVGNFCAPWHPLIATMTAEPHQTRAFTVRGEDTVYRERLTYRSASDRTLHYTHIAGIAGAQRYDASLTVTAHGTGSQITMAAEIEAAAPRAAQIAEGTRAIFQIGLDALAATLTPLILPGAPRLALTVTPPKPGPLCLFLHGIGGARGNWDAQLAAVAPVMRAAALDLRGYGDSTLGSDQSTVDAYCADILRIADHLGADKLVLVGLSYGAWLASSFAMRHPDRLAGLVLSGGCTGMSEAGPDERAAFRQSRETPLNAGQTPADFAPAVVNVIAGPQATAETRARLLQSMQAIPSATYRDALTCFTTPPERFDFAKLTMPVLMMTGEHDRLAPPAEIRGVAQRIAANPGANVRFETIPNAGHVCNIENPTAYNHPLLAFLQALT